MRIMHKAHYAVPLISTVEQLSLDNHVDVYRTMVNSKTHFVTFLKNFRNDSFSVKIS